MPSSASAGRFKRPSRGPERRGDQRVQYRGLALACLGLYGFVSFDVTRRTREIGIRMALGARPSQVIPFMLREIAVVVLIGVGLGGVLSIAATSAARGILFGIAPGSPLATVVGVVVLTLAGVPPATCRHAGLQCRSDAGAANEVERRLIRQHGIRVRQAASTPPRFDGVRGGVHGVATL